MKISIITTTFNSSLTVKDTLESVKIQNYPHLEHIIIDGFSTDNTLEIVKHYHHVTKIVSEKDRGIYDAINKGIKLATGDVLAVLNSDDYYTNALVVSDMVQLMQASGADTVYGDLDYVDQKNTQRVIRKWKSGHYDPALFYYGWMPPHPTFFAKRHLFEQYGCYDLDLGTAADYELMLRFLLKNKCSTAYLNKSIVSMRVGGASNQSFKARWLANRMDRLSWKKNDLEPYFFTTWLKPLRKISQYLS